MSPELAAALIAAIVSLIVAAISYFSNRASVRHEIRQGQYSEILKKRIELYPKLWRIHILYETNWEIENKPKDRKWAMAYLEELNEFNLYGGIFFSQGLYSRFAELRSLLRKAVSETSDDHLVAKDLQQEIRRNVYGSTTGPGLSTYEKDDLGSYRGVSIQRRKDDA